jgi:hypothetical protein
MFIDNNKSEINILNKSKNNTLNKNDDADDANNFST